MVAAVKDIKSRHIDRVVAHVAKKTAKQDATLLEKFISQYYGSVADEDLLNYSPVDLYGAAKAHLEFARKRKPGTPNIRIYNPSQRRDGWKSTHTVVEMINDDMPFL
ncbi:MAG: NAD-glutamate dehydrogenase, partial [Gammaproteobacteria bacterium]|nr:NAD-glutamate dehydrogenase [Gammaproteobacteria bacterium]